MALNETGIKLNENLSMAVDIQLKIEREQKNCTRLHRLLISGDENSSDRRFIEKTISEKKEEITSLLIRDLPKIKTKLNTIIDNFSINEDEKILLRHRYIDTLPWKYVAAKVSYSVTHTKLLWAKILNKL